MRTSITISQLSRKTESGRIMQRGMTRTGSESSSSLRAAAAAVAAAFVRFCSFFESRRLRLLGVLPVGLPPKRVFPIAFSS